MNRLSYVWDGTDYDEAREHFMLIFWIKDEGLSVWDSKMYLFIYLFWYLAFLVDDLYRFCDHNGI